MTLIEFEHSDEDPYPEYTSLTRKMLSTTEDDTKTITEAKKLFELFIGTVEQFPRL